MTNITIGAGAADYEATTMVAGYTRIDKTNPANANGILNTISIFANTAMTGVKVGTFYLVSGTTYRCRSYAVIGSVPSGSKQTFTGLSIAVNTGDYIGIYATGGSIERSSTGGGGRITSASSVDGFLTDVTYSSSDTTGRNAIEGSGSSGKKINGVTCVKWNGMTISKYNGN